MDDATSTIYSAFFVDEEGTMSSLRALSEVIAAEGLFGSLYADRATHYWHTPEAGGMGPCQGRVCGWTLAHIAARGLEVPLESLGENAPRVPIKPVPVGSLVDESG